MLLLFNHLFFKKGDYKKMSYDRAITVFSPGIPLLMITHINSEIVFLIPSISNVVKLQQKTIAAVQYFFGVV